jgi:hypothetical protein
MDGSSDEEDNSIDSWDNHGYPREWDNPGYDDVNDLYEDLDLLAQFQNKVEEEKTVYINRCMRLLTKNIRCFDRMQPAIDILQIMRRGPSMHVFGLPKPKPNFKLNTIKQVKQYWVGSHGLFWQYACDEVCPVMLEECIISSIPMPL